MLNNKLSCFSVHESNNKTCKNSTCRYWHDLKENQNCIINKVNENCDMTLEEVGKLFGITRMRVCQIEKSAIEKLRKSELV